MVIFLALRNIVKNKKNSAIVALLIAIITFLFFVGNSIISQAGISIRASYVDSLTGDVVLEKSADVSMNLFGANTPIIDSFFTIPVLPAYDAVMEIVSKEAGVSGITSQVSGQAYMNLLDLGEPVLLCGVDAASHFALFPGIVIEEGRLLQPGEYGAMITAERARRVETQSNSPLAIGTNMLLTSAGTTGFKIREVPIVGIFSFNNPGPMMNEIIIVDPQTVRVLNSIQVAGGVEAGENAVNLLNIDLDDLFGDTFTLPPVGEIVEENENGFSVDFLEDYLSQANDEMNQGNDESGGDWNFILLRLEDGVSSSAFISSLNKKVASFGVTAVNWRIAAGTSAILILMVQTLFNAGMFMVGVAGVIAAINILLIAVFRRNREIGTLRAIGASDAYIRSLIITENLVVAMIAGFIGVLGGALLLRWVNGISLNISNELISSLLGGPVLHLVFIPHIAVVSFVVAIALALAASVYPVEAAVRIEPMAAVRRN